MADVGTVLVVEDHPQNRKLARLLLELDGHTVLEARDAEEALEILSERSPDLILLDIQLPGMDGLAFLRVLRERIDLRDTPVLALTAYAMRGDRERFLAAGCDGYISKPLDTADFGRTVRSFLSRSHRSARRP